MLQFSRLQNCLREYIRYDKGRPSFSDDSVGYCFTAMDLGAAASVLELGAGSGKFTTCLLRRDPTLQERLTCSDPVPTMCATKPEQYTRPKNHP